MTPQARRRVLCVTYGGGHVAMMIPVVRALRESAEWEVTVLGLTTAAPRLAAAGIPFLGFRDLVEPEDEAALELGRALAQGMETGPVPWEESVAYLGLSYKELEREHGVPQAATLYREAGRQAFHPVRRLKRLIDRVMPDVVLTTNSPRAERAAMEAARQRGIPGVCMVDLLGHRQMEWLGRADYADRLCVLTSEVRQRFLATGRSPESVVVTGNPAFDSLADPTLPHRGAELRRSKGWRSDQFVVLYSPHLREPEFHPQDGDKGDPALPEKCDAALFEIVARHPSWQLVCRPHPSDTRHRPHLPANAELSGQCDPLHPLLHACDVCIVTMSTIGLEAAIAGTPVLSLEKSVLNRDLPLAGMGISRGVSTFDQLEEALRDVAERRHPIVPQLPQSGQAASRVAEVLETLVADRSESGRSARTVPARSRPDPVSGRRDQFDI